MCQLVYVKISVLFKNIPLLSKEVATMLKAEPNALAKQSEKEKSPSPTSKIL